jgi:hypothetical protein
VIGDLCTPGIVIEEGAKLEGRIMIGSEDKPEAKVRTEQRAEAKPTAAPTSAKPTPKAPLPPPAS